MQLTMPIVESNTQDAGYFEQYSSAVEVHFDLYKRNLLFCLSTQNTCRSFKHFYMDSNCDNHKAKSKSIKQNLNGLSYFFKETFF